MAIDDLLPEDICAYWEISRTQRKNELARGEPELATQGYETRGCYKCDGFKPECVAYIHRIKVFPEDYIKRGDDDVE